MMFAKNDLKSRLITGSYKKEDDLVSTASSQRIRGRAPDDRDMFGNEEVEKKKDPVMGYYYCAFTICIWIVLAIFVAV